MGYQPKTRENDASVEDFLSSIENPQRMEDGFRTLELFKKLTGEVPKMWGPAIVGFGSTILTYPDGRKLDWMATGFSPRKQNMTLYVICGSKKQPELLAKLGKHTSSVSCLYIKRLSDVNESVLEQIIKDAYAFAKKSSS